MRLAGIVLLVAGLVLAGGSYLVQGEVARQCASQEAQFGQLIGHPDAQACTSYPPLLNVAMLGGLALAAVGLLLQLRGR